MKRLSSITALTSLFALALPAIAGREALAQDQPKIEPVKQEFVDKPEFKDDGKRKQGWDPRLTIGATVSFAHNSNVVGQANGSGVALGAKIDLGADYNRGKHEWRSTLGVGAGVTRTPLVPEFVKTTDILHVDTIYLFHAVPWFGPFVRVSLDTSMFPGADVRPAEVTYAVARIEDPTKPDLVLAKRFHTSDPFKPLTLKQSLGVFFQPVARDQVSVEIRAGGGAQEVIADGQFAVKDDVTTPNVEIIELESANQVGPEIALAVWGAFFGKKVTYRAEIDVLTPVVHSKLPPGDTRNPLELTNVQIGAQLSFRLVDWASIDYQFKAFRIPQVVDEFQVQNSLLLTFGIALPAPPPPPVCIPAPPPVAPPAPPPAAPPAPPANPPAPPAQ